MKYFVTTQNLFDPAVVSVDFFDDGGLYAEGELPMKATVTNYGNTEMDFDVEASILYALPTQLNCGPLHLMVIRKHVVKPLKIHKNLYILMMIAMGKEILLTILIFQIQG